MGGIHDYLKLLIVGLIPVVFCVVFYHLDRTKLEDLDYRKKQILYGIVFGIFSILGTEHGVPINGAVINVRDAAPIICAIVLGGPAGIIAGFIGGVERFLAAMWGAGEFTKWACTIATIIAGFYGASFRKYIFDGHIPKSFYGFMAGIIVEIIHMNLIFLTHFNDMLEAIKVVKACTIPMVTINSLVCGLAIIVIRIYKARTEKHSVHDKESVSRIFQRNLMTLTVVGFLATTALNIFMQYNMALGNVSNELTLSIDDAKGDVALTSDNHLLVRTMDVTDRIGDDSVVLEADSEYLAGLLDEYKVSEINIVDGNGIITASSNPDFIGYDFHSGEQSLSFFESISGHTAYVQEYMPISYDDSIYRKYAGYHYNDGFVQVGIDGEKYYQTIAADIAYLAKTRRVGQSGSIIVAELNGDIVSSNLGESNNTLEKIGITIDSNDEEYKVYKAVIDDMDTYYSFVRVEGYYIIGTISSEEAMMYEEMSLYFTIFLEILVFTAIFILMFVMIDRKIVNDVRSINSSLIRITKGNLDTIVDVRDSREFDSLSNGINTTVDRLKELITEAEERNKAELEYAAEIQRSALPSNFPAYPERNEFDIHAMMKPAREVGGDFYDFYFIEANKLVISVSDVSGKGVPASLFMMRGKTLIKSYAQRGIMVNDIFTNVNYNRCEGNETGLFITSWMGIIDLKTGHLDFTNAGHNPPLIRKANGEYEYLRTKPDFVMGGMEGIAYKLYEMDLEEGSEIFLYTDGLTEAQNSTQELYGEDRLLHSANTAVYSSSKEFCEHIKQQIDEFVGDADQFDDITMLHLRFIRKA